MNIIKRRFQQRPEMKKQSILPTDPEVLKQRLRFLILTLICMSLFSNYFIFDQPALLKGDIINHFTPIYGAEATNFYFSFLYSFYSIPNIILPLLGGSLCDKIGYRKMSISFMIFVVIGQLVVYTGSLIDNLKLMVFGRLIFGIGGEAIGISANIVTIKWFAGKELSFANALTLSLIRSATVLNTLLSPKIAEHRGMTYAFGFGSFLTLFSLGSLFLLNYLDYAVECRITKQDDIDEKKTPQDFNFGEVISQIKEDIRSFPRIFWLMTALMTTFYTSVLMFISFSSSVITELWLPITNSMQQNEEIAGDLMSIPYLCCTFLSPLVGLLIDKQGQRIKLLLIGCFMVFIGLSSMLFFYPIYAMICLGIGYALFGSTIWTTITFVVSQDKIGTAYGVMNSIQNFAFFLLPLIIAVISSGASQITVVIFFLILSVVSLILSIWLFKEDYQREISLDENNQVALMSLLKRELLVNKNQKLENTQEQEQDDEEEQLHEAK